MRTKLVFEQGTPQGEAAINKAISDLEAEGYQITQIMNVTHNEKPLDDTWKVLIFAAKEREEDIIEKPVTRVVLDRKLN